MDNGRICPHCMREMKNNTAKFCARCGKDLTDRTSLPHQLAPFTVLKDKYLVGKVLGQGGFGITYIGMDMTLRMPVAIKELYPTGLCSRDSSTTSLVTIYDEKNAGTVQKWKDRFKAEALSLAKCSGLSGIVAVKEFFTENNTAYIVQEYLDGPDLNEYRRQCGGKIPADVLLPAMKSVITSLGKVHEEELIHRDISPDNIKRLTTGEMKLFDFGAARDYAAESNKTVMLKHGYAPEEQYRSNGVQGPWTDIYALAATMYECLTGVKPPSAMDRLYSDELKRPNELGAGIPIHVENALLKAMSVRANDRYQSMQQFYDALYKSKTVDNAEQRWIEEQKRIAEQREIEEQKRTKARQKKGSKLVIGLIVAVVFLACVGIGVFFLVKSNVVSKVSGNIESALSENDEKSKKTEKDAESEKSDEKENENENADEEVDAENKDETADVVADNEIDGFLVDELSDGTIAIIGYTGDEKELLIPEQLDGKAVSIVQKLETDDVKVLTIPGCVVAVGENAIVSDSIKKIVLRDGIQNLNDGAFKDCKKLEEINIPKSIGNIGAAVFSREFIEKQSESRGIYYIDGIALAIKANQTEFKWSSNTRGIAGDFWKACRGSEEVEVEIMQIPDGVEFIGKGAFRCVHAFKIRVPETVEKIGKYALGCNADKEPYTDVVIVGKGGSEAEKYALENSISFEEY